MVRSRFLSIVILVGMLFSQSVPLAMAATCDSAQFVSDITIPDGSSLAPGTIFTKTWRLLNSGSCTWTTSYKLLWVGGDRMNAPLTFNLPVNVPPGRMLDLSVRLTAPSALGHYKALFKISNTTGTQFGIGNSSNDAFWTDINTVDVSAVIYDFVASAPYAQWKSGAGVLPFPGASGDYRGYSMQVSSPHLEDDSYDTAPGLLTVPQNKLYGYIQATYPEIQIQSGDQLQTLVNCEFGATGCRATFRIDYLLPNNTQRTLWTWSEAYDRRFYRANLNLSSLAGQKVRFIFMLLSGGPASGDRAIWGSPRIVRTGTYQPPAPPATLTPLPPLPATPTPLDQPPPTISPSGCDKATFVTDVTVPDKTIFAPGAMFTKTWRLKNTGACIWTPSYKLVYYSGDHMNGPTAVNLPWGAAPNQTVDISVNLTAPTDPNEYRGYWILQNVNGQLFGIGTTASNPIWVDINVSGVSTNEGGYDFAFNTCAAQWSSGAGPLPCPGTEGDSKGFVISQQSTQLEDGTMGPALSILISPENKFNGYIQGVFPAFTVQPRDHFVTTTGCEFNYSCYVTFRLDYMTATGAIFNFWSWREQSDRKNNMANVDLSPLAGRSVRFILTVLAIGTATGDRVRWIGPSIVRVENGTPPTVTPNPSTWPLYTNSQYGFQFKYPSDAQIVDQATNSIKLNLPFASGTNLREKYLQMSVAEDAGGPCHSPLASGGLPPNSTETVTINGISFLKQTVAEGAAGNLYDWVAYSTLNGNACISMTFMLHSLSTGALDPSIHEFNKTAESAVFTQIMSMFTWIPATATPTPAPISGTIVPSPQINKLYMNDSYHGWAVGNSYVLKTSDGGATWYNVTSPNVTRVVSAFFANANKGWMMATLQDNPNKAILFRTSNGGSTWLTYSIPFDDGYIQFLDDSNGFVLAGQGIGMQKQPVSLYQTSDGGATWTLKFAHVPTMPEGGLPVSGHKDGMTFRNTSRGWIGGDVPLAGSVYIFRTDDGGVTWAQQPMTVPAGYESAFTGTTAPVFFGTNNAVLPVWMGSAVGQRDLFLYVTYNGGTTWTRSAAFAQNSFHADIASVRDAFSWDSNGFFWVTNNTGLSWRKVTPNINFGENLRDIDFISATTGWASILDINGSRALYRTTDGGSTWTTLFSNISTGPLPDLAISDLHMGLQNATCLAAGDTVGIQVGIKNNGQGAAGSFVVRVNNIDQTVNGLAAGESTTLFFPSSINPVSAIVDATSAVQESDESNNSRSEMIPVPTPPLPCPTASELLQTIVSSLNTRNFSAAQTTMGTTFGMSFWQSQPTSYTPDLAIQQLQTNYIGASTQLVPDANKDLITLLGGMNPYSMMNLDPAKSQALYVSGWGSDGKGEAVLFVTQGLDGRYYWHSVLIAPTGFAPPTVGGPHAVIGVAPGGVLPIRVDAGANQTQIGSFARDAVNVMRTGPTVNADNTTWWEVLNPSGGVGWVDSNYLTEYVTQADFCADTRVPALIEQLKNSMLQSNGATFASNVGAPHGVMINFWRGVSPIPYTKAAAQSIFSDTTPYNWGTGPAGGPTGTTGTFAQVVQADLVDMFNSSYQLGCDNPSYATGVTATPWTYTNIHYYSITKPPSSAGVFDWKVWLIGIEYVDGVPYLYATVHYVHDA